MNSAVNDATVALAFDTLYTNCIQFNLCEMTLRIESLEIDDHILDKIESKHGVALEEAEETCLSTKKHVRRGREGLYKIFGQTAAGRYLLVVLAHLESSRWKIVTAREMSDKEIRLYKQACGG